MAITPDTDIRILKVPLSIDNKNQLTFENVQAQETYFKSLPYIEMNKCTYLRKEGIIRFYGHIDDLIEYNYVMYKNNNYSDKYFYAFITGMRYENNNMTSIFIATDVFQTWQFDFTFKESFIEREMLSTADDVPGANLVPEGLETGEFTIDAVAQFDELEPYNVIAYLGTLLPSFPGSTVTIQIPEGSFIVNGVVSSVAFLLCNNKNYAILMNALQEGNFSDQILTAFSVPKFAVQDFLTGENLLRSPAYEVYGLFNGNTFLQSIITKTLNARPSKLNGYTPVNKKLLTYPYLYLGFNPSNGSSKIFRYEDFLNGTPSFDMISEVNPNPTVIFIPKNYRGVQNNLSDKVSLNGYPTLSTRTDYFNTWLAQNSSILAIQMAQEQFNYEIGQIRGGINTAGSVIGNLVTGNIGSAISGAVNSGLDFYANSQNHEFYIQNQLAQVEKQQMLPDKANLGSSNATLVGYGYIDNDIFARYSIKAQFAKRIDKFFSMYGYLTNEVKLPNLNNRSNWNYVKTIGANIVASIPQEDLQALKNLFDNGITLWHNASTFLDYSQSNT